MSAKPYTAAKRCSPAFYLALETITISIGELTKAVRDSDKQTIESIMRWFNDRQQVPFGYGWCLSITGANPNAVRERINAIVKKSTRGRRNASVVYRQRYNVAAHAAA